MSSIVKNNAVNSPILKTEIKENYRPRSNSESRVEKIISQEQKVALDILLDKRRSKDDNE